MAWEALNNIAETTDLPLVVLVNDNGRSYTPTVGGLAQHLTSLRTHRRYEQVLDLVKRGVSKAPVVGGAAYDVLHGVKSGLKDVLAPQGLFADLGLKYVGPVDGHDIAAVEQALIHAKQFGGPVLVHCLTRKGNGFEAAEAHEEDRFHAVGKIDAVTGRPLGAARAADLDRRLRRRARPPRGPRRAGRRDHRGHDLPDRAAQVRRGVPGPASSTSASPSSTP